MYIYIHAVYISINKYTNQETKQKNKYIYIYINIYVWLTKLCFEGFSLLFFMFRLQGEAPLVPPAQLPPRFPQPSWCPRFPQLPLQVPQSQNRETEFSRTTFAEAKSAKAKFP